MEFTYYIKKFVDVGLTEREAKVYITLLTKKIFTASELTEIVDIPRTKIYEVLQRMVHRGICIERRLGRNKVYEAVKPETALQFIIDNYKTELNKKIDIVQELKSKFEPVFEEKKEIVNPLDYIEVINDNNLIHKKGVSLLEKTHHELLAFNKGPYSCDTPKKVDEQVDENIALLKRGGNIKGLYERRELEEHKWLFDIEKELIKYGQQSRVVEELPVKMLVFDEKAVMFALNEPMSLASELTMISIEHRDIVKACKILFNTFWEKGCDLDEAKINHKEYADI
jgi:sugar-specific transcriptional regulator TrmB